MYPTDKSTEYAAGFDCGFYGPDETNSNYKHFSTENKLAEWESGKRDGENAKSEKGKLAKRFYEGAPHLRHVLQDKTEPECYTLTDRQGSITIFTRDGRTGIIDRSDLTKCYELPAAEFLQLRDRYNDTAETPEPQGSFVDYKDLEGGNNGSN